MHTPRAFVIAVLVSCALLQSAVGQGSLTPPGGPASTMKTLDQIYSHTDARVAITNSGGATISQPGSYYLATNITVSSGNGVSINVSGVTLDLNGFTISSTAASPNGIGVSINANNLYDITICNGHIRGGVTNNGSGTYSGPGFSSAINYPGALPYNLKANNITVSGCGGGIYLGLANSAVAESCTVRTVSTSGITAGVVTHCMASDCLGTGIYGYVVSDCRGDSIAGAGISATVAQNCHGTSVSNYGVYALVSATGCYGRSTSGSAGVNAENAIFCTGYRPGGAANSGFMATGCVAESGTNNFTYKYNMP